MLRAKGAAVVELPQSIVDYGLVMCVEASFQMSPKYSGKRWFFRRPFPDPRISGHFASLPEVRPVAKMGKLKLLLGFYELMLL